jgi:predicted permease
MNDFRYGLRRIALTPAFTAIVVLTLALGIGANTAIFSFVDALLLRPLPYDDPEELVTIQHFYPSLNALEAPVSAPGFRDYRDRTRSFEGMGISSGWGPSLTGMGEPERVYGGRVSAGYLEAFGLAPALGRGFLPEEDAPGRNRVVILSDGFWKRAFGGDRDILSRTIQLDGESYDIVGVMPPGFRDFFGRARELWAPLGLDSEEFTDERRTNEWLNLVARLRDGVSEDEARTEMLRFAETLKQQYPDNYPADWSLRVDALSTEATGGIRSALLVLMGAVGFVLLIACANVANLLLARSAGRLKDVAIRSALGAKRWQLIRQLLAESVLLAAAGGIVGLLLAYWGVRGLEAMSPFDLTGIEVGLDGKVLAFTAVVALATGLLFGIAPALQTTGGNVQDTLREGGRGAHADRKGHRIRKGLVVAELALALTLLTGAGLLMQSFARLQNVDPGFDADNLLTFRLSLPEPRYPSDTARIAFFRELLPRIRALPGVRAAGMSQVLPFSGSWSTGSFMIEGLQLAEGQPRPWGDIRIVDPGYADVMKIPVLRGRFFTEQDMQGGPPVVVVDEEMVRRYWPNTDPIGKRITRGDENDPNTTWVTVVGVVGHAAHEGLDAEARVQLYAPHAQFGAGSMMLAVRAAGDPEALTPAIRRAIYEVDANLPISQVRTMESQMADAVGQRKLTMMLVGGFAGLALLLASLGIYGVMSSLVLHRRQEMGVRMALGAQPRDLLGLVLREGVALVALGVVIGLAGSYGLTRLIQAQLFAVRATDPVTYGAVALVLVATALLATWLPAHRATRLDPLIALRQE